MEPTTMIDGASYGDTAARVAPVAPVPLATAPSESANGSNNGSGKQRSPFVPQEDWMLLSQGAEARVWKLPNNNNTLSFPILSSSHSFVVAKERFSKSYRHPVLDEKLTKQRCRAEGRLLEKCLLHYTKNNETKQKANDEEGETEQQQTDEKQGIRVPKVLRVDPPVLYLEYMDHHITVRDHLNALLEELVTQQQQEEIKNQIKRLAESLGTVLARLHNLGIVHGDLTTSNMMVLVPETSSSPSFAATEIVLIDFGLARNTESAEERAVDLYVLERALQATHPPLAPTPTASKEKENDEEASDDDTGEAPRATTSQQQSQRPFFDFDFCETVLETYKLSANKADATITRLDQVRQRGRKRECFG